MKFYLMLVHATLKSIINNIDFPLFATTLLLYTLVFAIVQALAWESIKAKQNKKTSDK